MVDNSVDTSQIPATPDNSDITNLQGAAGPQGGGYNINDLLSAMQQAQAQRQQFAQQTIQSSKEDYMADAADKVLKDHYQEQAEDLLKTPGGEEALHLHANPFSDSAATAGQVAGQQLSGQGVDFTGATGSSQMLPSQPTATSIPGAAALYGQQNSSQMLGVLQNILKGGATAAGNIAQGTASPLGNPLQTIAAGIPNTRAVSPQQPVGTPSAAPNNAAPANTFPANAPGVTPLPGAVAPGAQGAPINTTPTTTQAPRISPVTQTENGPVQQILNTGRNVGSAANNVVNGIGNAVKNIIAPGIPEAYDNEYMVPARNMFDMGGTFINPRTGKAQYAEKGMAIRTLEFLGRSSFGGGAEEAAAQQKMSGNEPLQKAASTVAAQTLKLEQIEKSINQEEKLREDITKQMEIEYKNSPWARGNLKNLKSIIDDSMNKQFGTLDIKTGKRANDGYVTIRANIMDGIQKTAKAAIPANATHYSPSKKKWYDAKGNEVK